MNKLPHDSAHKHVSGESIYVNDINTSQQALIGHLICSPFAHAKIKSINLKDARALEGIHAILSAEDIPGENQMGPVVHDEVCLVKDEASFIGQCILLIAADNKAIARKAEKLIRIEYEVLEATITLEQAMEKNLRLQAPRRIECGNIEQGFADSAHIISGSLHTGGQEHWYLETQSCLCIPGEDDEMKVISSTQHPSETQAIVAEVLGIKRNDVEVEVKRMGGAFGGKETQANHYAAWSALLARATGRPVKIHLNRDEDQIYTGKRHPFFSTYKAGFDKDGRILAMEVDMNEDAGWSTDLSMAILERALFHIDNAYYIPNLKVVGHSWKTNKPSNTAFRGFGGPQGMAVIENLIDRIARFLRKDAFEIRKLNFYQDKPNNVTHYGQGVKNNRLSVLSDSLLKSSDYYHRRKKILEFNKKSPINKRGIAMTPVKFGISFTTSFLNQAGALVNIYQDGTVLVNHGGTEMGQGLHTKMIRVAASELGIDPAFIKVNATNTSKVPNTSATAASSGSDLNGMAVKNAIEKIKARLAELAIQLWDKPAEGISEIVFKDNEVFHEKHPELHIAFPKLIANAYLNQVSLSATGFYKTPGIHYNREKGKGKPFHYFAFGMAVSEVEIDSLTGEVNLLRTDILHDVGKSLNPAIDKGQIEGGFIQGCGWVTTEDLKYDAEGHLLNHSPDTYKIPTINDIPDDFRVDILKDAPNPNTIKQSKAVGEPPFILAFSVWLAIKDAISSIGDHRFEPPFSLPASHEVVLHAIEEIKKQKALDTE